MQYDSQPPLAVKAHLTLEQGIREALLPLISGRERHICIIDPPDYPNVGDSAIFLGTLDFLRAFFPKTRVSYVASESFSEECKGLIEDASLLLFQGGGNFGDLWPHIHQFRLRILREFPRVP